MIIETLQKPMDILEFEKAYGLTLRVQEHRRENSYCRVSRWTCQFDRLEVKDGPILTSAYGSDTTILGALNDYATQISMKNLVHCAYGDNRREFYAPPLSPVYEGNVELNMKMRAAGVML